MSTIKDFTDMTVWQKAHQLSVEIYKLTEKFPQSEQYSLTSQLRRAASSVSANIAEGFGRSSRKDQEHYYVMASGSLYELRNHLYLAKDVAYISSQVQEAFNSKCIVVHQLLHGLLRAHRSSKIDHQKSKGSE
jgi:four helix bundle protein